MVDEYPEVIAGTRIVDVGPFVGEIKKQMVKINGGLMVDSTFFEVFPQEFITGQSDNALTNPNSLVLTETLALNYFNDENPVGMQLVFEDEKFTVTAVNELPRSKLTGYRG
jgi:putative ABC transport system permease protein